MILNQNIDCMYKFTSTPASTWQVGGVVIRGLSTNERSLENLKLIDTCYWGYPINKIWFYSVNRCHIPCQTTWFLAITHTLSGVISPVTYLDNNKISCNVTYIVRCQIVCYFSWQKQDSLQCHIHCQVSNPLLHIVKKGFERPNTIAQSILQLKLWDCK